MTEFIGKVLSLIFGGNSGLATFIISMFPLIELKGGIPIGMSKEFFGSNALEGIESFLFALAGSSAIVFVLPLIFKPILNFLKKSKLFKRLGNMIENKISNHSKEMINKKNTFLKCLGVFVFVAIPLPLTGVWTGCCVAVAIGLDYWQAVASVFFGNIVAGLIIYFVCSIFPNFTTYLFYIILGIIIVSIVISLIRKVFIKKYSTDK